MEALLVGTVCVCLTALVGVIGWLGTKIVELTASLTELRVELRETRVDVKVLQETIR